MHHLYLLHHHHDTFLRMRSSSFVGDAKKVIKGLSFLSKNSSTSNKSTSSSTPPVSSNVVLSKPNEYEPQQRRLSPSERPLPPQPPNAFPNNRPDFVVDSDKIGEGKLDFSNVYKEGTAPIDEWISLPTHFHLSDKGKVHLKIEFTPETEPAPATQQQ
ncbi:hypothetical protein K492DRAFT_192019 [Lichtheimia hyalospora FSU 10163]|nr:hypothetical protein K492DRAFT_192019 [Lichtheimia hyalospora FSU 10163]